MDSKHSKKFQTNAGFSTLEILIAMTILVLAISAVILVSFGSQSILIDGQTNAEAIGKAEKLLEIAQANARKDFKMVNPVGTTTDGIYQEAVYASSTDFFTKNVTALVTWQVEHNRKQSISLSSIVTNFENAVGGDTCDSILSGNWTNPQVKNATTNFAQIVGDSSGTYTVTDLDVYQRKLFVSVNNPSLTSGPQNPSTGADSNALGTITWSNPSNIKVSDNARATANLNAFNTTHYIKATGFGFTIPAGATILGIKVDIERSRAGGTSGEVRDSQVKIIHGDTSLGTTNKADIVTNWPTSDAVASYGNTSDLWGDNWSPADVNSANFGVALSVTGSSASTNRTANVDVVQITITYIKEFYILNVSNPTNPTLITGLGSNSGIATGFNAVATDGRYAYVATNAGPASGQLQIIDTSPAFPLLISTFKIPGVTGTGSQAVGQSIFYKDGFVYLGLTKTLSGPEFNIIDVHTPAVPVWLGGYAVGNYVNSIFTKGKYAYLATPNAQELITLDIGDPIHPTAVGGYDAPDSVGNGKSISLVGDTLYLGRTVTASNPELYILNNTTPSAMLPTPLGTKEISSSVNSLIVRDYLAFLTTTNSQFQIWNVASTTNILQFATPLTLPNSGVGGAMDCEGNFLYVTSVPSSGTFANKGFLSIITAGP